MSHRLPLLEHPLQEQTVFTPEALLDAVREGKGLSRDPVPRVCLLDFDGDITDWLVSSEKAKRVASWACFHTPMFSLTVDGEECGIVPRTIGGPYAVLVAEQLAASGVELILALTSAGRVSPRLPLPSFVLPTAALRDEGTSFHYLSPAAVVEAQTGLKAFLHEELTPLGRAIHEGTVWTTDAPYRETRSQLDQHANAGVLAVEMQAASLFAFAKARGVSLAVVCQVTNGIDYSGEAFDKGAHEDEYRLIRALCRAGHRYINTPRGRA
jgi:uridine phosphorylase